MSIRTPGGSSLPSVPSWISERYRHVRGNPAELLVWSSPLLVVLYLELLPQLGPVPSLELLIAGIIGLGVFAVAARRPGTALLVIVVALPFQIVIFSTLYHWGVPAAILRPLAAWKELMGLAVLAAAWNARRAGAARSIDRVDLWAMGYLALVALYALVPQLASDSAPTAISLRLTAFRANAGFVLLFLAARHAPIAGHHVGRLIKAVFSVAVIVAAVALFEFAFSSSWNDLVVNRLGVSRYLTDVLDAPPLNPADLRSYSPLAGRDILRAGSVLFSSLALGFALIVGFSIGCDRIAGGEHRQASVVGLAIIAMGVLVTQTRTAIVAMVIAGVLALRPTRARQGAARTRLGLVFAAGAVLTLPLLASSGIVDRFVGAVNGEDEGADLHKDSFSDSLDRLIAHPLGEGLGTSAGAGQRFSIDNVSVSENYYLQIGNETGVFTMVGFIGLVVAVTRRLQHWAARAESTVLSSLRGAAVALGLGAIFLHVWLDLTTAWTLWGLAGAALGVAERAGQRELATSSDAQRTAAPSRSDQPSSDARHESNRSFARAWVPRPPPRRGA